MCQSVGPLLEQSGHTGQGRAGQGVAERERERTQGRSDKSLVVTVRQNVSTEN